MGRMYQLGVCVFVTDICYIFWGGGDWKLDREEINSGYKNIPYAVVVFDR